MERIDVKCKDLEQKLFKFGQLYCSANIDDDIIVNGSITLVGDNSEPVENIVIYGNICNSNNEIMYILHDYTHYNFKYNKYCSFSMSCRDTSRFFDPDEISYVELYALINQPEE